MKAETRAGKMIKFDPERLKSIFEEANITQTELANLLEISQRHLNRIINEGEMKKTMLQTIADHLNISIEYLSGNVDIDRGYYGQRRWEHQFGTGEKTFLNDFMIAHGFNDGYCDNLTNDDLQNICDFIHFTVKGNHDIIGNFVDNLIQHEERIKELEKQLANISAERSDETEAAAAKNKNKK